MNVNLTYWVEGRRLNVSRNEKGKKRVRWKLTLRGIR